MLDGSLSDDFPILVHNLFFYSLTHAEPWSVADAAPFVKEPIFAVQSRFDEFQLMCLLQLPCFKGQEYVPPFLPSNCTQAERSAIVKFGGELVAQMQPFLEAKPESGTWLVSCIQQ